MRWHTYLYARKSSEEDDRQTLSLDAQEKECRDYAARHGLAVDELLREAHSARRPGRPLFDAMLKDAEARRRRGQGVRVLCHKPDRLLRNLADWARINDLMEEGVELTFVSGSYPNNAQGKMAFGINVLFAKYYVDNLSEEVKKGLREKVRRGEWPGPAPFGYRNANGKIEVDPERAPYVRRAFEYYATGEYSIERLAVRLHAEGLVALRSGRRPVKSFFKDHLLRNPFYCGLMRYGGETHPGTHPPLVPTALYERVQNILDGRSRPRGQRRAFRFGGIFLCEGCGCAVTGDIKKGRYVYYRCTHKRGPCGEGYIREEALEELLLQRVEGSIRLPDEAVRALRQAAEELRVRSERRNDRDLVGRRLAELEARRSGLLELRLAGHIDDAEFVAKREELAVAGARLRERQAALELPPPDPLAAVNSFVGTCGTVREVFRRGSDADLREFLRTVGSNYRLGTKKVDFEPVKPFDAAVQGRSRPLWWRTENEVRTVVRHIVDSYREVGAMGGQA